MARREIVNGALSKPIQPEPDLGASMADTAHFLGAKGRLLARETLDRLDQHAIAPTPLNYEVWAAHVAGLSPELSRAIDERLARHEPFTDAVGKELFARHLAPRPQVVAESTDALTGLADRTAFEHAVRAGLAEASACGAPLAILLCEIDHFQRLIRTCGRPTGDAVVRLVARLFGEHAGERCTLARYGADAFALVLNGASLTEAAGMAERIRGATKARKLARKSTGERLGVVTMSFGVAQAREHDSGASLIARAAAALMAARSAGGDRVACEGEPAAMKPLRAPLPRRSLCQVREPDRRVALAR
jgi:diguanylate cyclase (GGDEF)-like protein